MVSNSSPGKLSVRLQMSLRMISKTTNAVTTFNTQVSNRRLCCGGPTEKPKFPSFAALAVAAFWALSGTQFFAAQSDYLLLDGEWQFTYTHSTGVNIPTPLPSIYTTTIRIPGWWDEQLDRMRNAPWFTEA